MICQIYRSARREGMYLYLPKAAPLEELPEALLKQFGKAEPALVVNITQERKLARATASEVLAQIDAQGFYLQMPPTLHGDDNGEPTKA